jgi:hypothetical protein
MTGGQSDGSCQRETYDQQSVRDSAPVQKLVRGEAYTETPVSERPSPEDKRGRTTIGADVPDPSRSAAVVEKDPAPVSAVTKNVPPELDRLISRRHGGCETGAQRDLISVAS